MPEKTCIQVGGQAVVEGVMMRSPKGLAVAVLRANGEIVVRESPWRSYAERWAWLKWPFLRGAVVLLESLSNGINALQFSAQIAFDEENKTQSGQPDGQPDGQAKKPEGGAEMVTWLMVAVSVALGLGLFVALPHLIVWFGSWLMGRQLTVQQFLFHVLVGGVKFGVFVGYIALISRMEDIRRVFMYHGAEHQAIHTYEQGEDLTVDNARRYSPLHARCGTTFLILVIAVSIVVFSVVFPPLIWAIGEPTRFGWLNQVIFILIKVPLLFPVAGLAYELQKWTSRHLDQRWARALAWPGMALQRMTTRPPTDRQLEAALASLQVVLWRERVGVEPGKGIEEKVTVYPDYPTLVQKLAQG